jgi:isocitrate dehydrogenase
MYQHIQVPTQGAKITVNVDNSLNVPLNPIIPFIEGDGTGVDTTPVMINVVNAAVKQAYFKVSLLILYRQMKSQGWGWGWCLKIEGCFQD